MATEAATLAPPAPESAPEPEPGPESRRRFFRRRATRDKPTTPEPRRWRRKAVSGLVSALVLLALISPGISWLAAGGVEPISRLQEDATLRPLDSVEREALPRMVLTPLDLAKEFPLLRLAPALSGFIGNERFAQESHDPGDTGPVLAGLGRIDGYSHQFTDEESIIFGIESGRQPFNVSAFADRFQSPQAAQAFLEREASLLERDRGVEIEGVTFLNLQDFEPPSALGEDAHAGRFTVFIATERLRATSFVYFVQWRRGAVVASVNISSLVDDDRHAAAARLARRMDLRIQGF